MCQAAVAVYGSEAVRKGAQEVENTKHTLDLEYNVPPGFSLEQVLQIGQFSVILF